jgi:WD40 repeat protein
MVGRGGFGTVYRAIDTGLGRVVAVKVPKEGVLGSEREQERFIREARAAAALRHPHIVPIYEVGGTREQPFIVSGFVAGCTLSKAVASRRFEPREAAAIVRDVAGALHYAHERLIIHRDVKPSNIMLDDQGDPFLMDFGLARRDGEVLITVAGQILGTPAYMSPEQAEGRPADGRSDVYSLGVVLYELLTGERPFQGTMQSVLHQVIHAQPRSPIVANRAVPRDLEKICLKCLQKSPSDRYQSAQEMEADLGRFLEGLPVRARPIAPAARVWRWARRHPKTSLLFVTAATLGLILPVVWKVYATRAETAERQSAENIRLAERASASARRSEDTSQDRLEKLLVSKGNALVESGDAMRALSWFAAAYERKPTEPLKEAVHRARLVSTLTSVAQLSRMWRRPGSINSVALCPGQSLIGVASTDCTATLWSLTENEVQEHVFPHPSVVCQCAFSSDGKRFATSCNDGNIRIWLTSALSRAPLVLRGDDLPNWMSFDPAGTHLAAASKDGVVRLWDASNGSQLAILPHPAAVRRLAFNDDGSFLATAGSEGGVHLWSVATRQQAQVFSHEQPVNCVAFAPRKGWLVSGSEDGTVRAWNEKSRAPLFELRHDSPVVALAFAANGNLIAVGCRNGRIKVWDARTREALPGDFRHNKAVQHLVFSSTGDTLVSASEDRTVRIWDLTRGTAAASPLVHPAGVVWAGFNADEEQLFSGSFDGVLREWKLSKPYRAEIRANEMGTFPNAQMSPDGRWVLLTGSRPAQLCDLNGTRLVATTLADTPGVRCAAFAPDSSGFVLGRGDRTLERWVSLPRPTRLETRASGPLKDLCLSPDGRILVTANTDGTAQVVSFERGSAPLSFAHGKGLERALFGAGRTIYTVGGRRPLCAWDIASGALLFEAKGLENVDDLRLSPTHDILLAIRPRSADAIVCRASTGEILHVFKHSGLLSAAISEDTNRLVTAGEDNSARIWDAHDGRILASVSHQHDVTCCAIRSDSLLIATGSADKTARVWDARTGEPVSPPLRHSDHVIYVGFRPGGKELVTVSADARIRTWVLDEARSKDALLHLARATGGQKIDNEGAPIALTSTQIEGEWNASVHTVATDPTRGAAAAR